MYVFKKILRKLGNSTGRIWNTFRFLFPRFIGILSVYFLRKTNTFIKSKYSKNRQWSKGIVYFGLWFGVISAFAFTYYNYRFLFMLSYLWWFTALVSLTTVIVGFKKFRAAISPNVFNVFF